VRVERKRRRDPEVADRLGEVDRNSGEAEVVQALYDGRYTLPDRAQYRPVPNVYAEADFYYERSGRPGVCVFLDGPQHDEPTRRIRDAEGRELLADFGYRIIVLRYDQPWFIQFKQYPEVFGNL